MENEAPAAPIEALTESELEYLAITRRDFRIAKSVLDSYVTHVILKYKLKPEDSFDTTTGAITRTPEA